jgi:hypothetical protein
MSEKLGEYKDTPIISIDKVTETQFVVGDCPFCGENHSHGRNKTLEINQLSHKVSHCSELSDYYIVKTGDLYE